MASHYIAVESQTTGALRGNGHEARSIFIPLQILISMPCHSHLRGVVGKPFVSFLCFRREVELVFQRVHSVDSRYLELSRKMKSFWIQQCFEIARVDCIRFNF